jgi:uncharacterized protein YbaR (Trm112 family)
MSAQELSDWTRRAKERLDAIFSRGVAEDDYQAHTPIYGLHGQYRRPGRIYRLAKHYAILRWINRIHSFDNFIDIGGAEGYSAHHVAALFGARSYTADLSFELNLRAREFYGLPAVALNAAALPVKDKSVDVVLCSEVIEHVEDPVATILELSRVARKCLIVTSLEFRLTEIERNLELKAANFSLPHGERNWFVPGDFRLLLGKDVLLESQRSLFEWENEGIGTDEAKRLIQQITAKHSLTHDSAGIVAVKPMGDAVLAEEGLFAEEDILNHLFTNCIPADYESHQFDDWVDDNLLELLCCPCCKGTLHYCEGELTCAQCGRRYPVNKGIPLLYGNVANIPWHEIGTKERVSKIVALRDKFRDNKPSHSRWLRSMIKLSSKALYFCHLPPSCKLKALAAWMRGRTFH